MKKLTIANDIRNGRKPNPYELRASDVGKLIAEDLGHVLKLDVGKLVYVDPDDGVAGIENDQQRQEREKGNEQYWKSRRDRI